MTDAFIQSLSAPKGQVISYVSILTHDLLTPISCFQSSSIFRQTISLELTSPLSLPCLNIFLLLLLFLFWWVDPCLHGCVFIENIGNRLIATLPVLSFTIPTTKFCYQKHEWRNSMNILFPEIWIEYHPHTREILFLTYIPTNIQTTIFRKRQRSTLLQRSTQLPQVPSLVLTKTFQSFHLQSLMPVFFSFSPPSCFQQYISRTE